MLWCIYMWDKPNRKALRRQVQPLHTEYMKVKDPQIFFSGPLQGDDGAEFHGAMWIISAENREEAEAFAANEPYNKAGLFETVRIYRTRGAHFHPELSGEVAVKPPPRDV